MSPPIIRQPKTLFKIRNIPISKVEEIIFKVICIHFRTICGVVYFSDWWRGIVTPMVIRAMATGNIFLVHAQALRKEYNNISKSTIRNTNYESKLLWFSHI